MRLKSLMAAAVLAATMLGLAQPAAAFDRREHPGAERVVSHYIYAPRYRHVYHVADPWAYYSEPRGYYPYYNSGYWRPAHLVRRTPPHALPPYHASWGAPKKSYVHRPWHDVHHGRHYPWHW